MEQKSKNQPWLSVLIPTYNGETYLATALNSILIQNDSNIECIIVDDGSTDTTHSIINSYCDKLPIKFLRKKRIGNTMKNTNVALLEARGEYICILHQDDIWLENRLKVLKKLTQEYPQIGLFLHSALYINDKGKRIGKLTCPLSPYPQKNSPQTMLERLLIQNFIALPAPIFKRTLALEVSGMDENLWYTYDWDLWLKLAAHGETLYYREPLCGLRIHKHSQTSTRTLDVNDIKNQLLYVFNKHYSKLEMQKQKNKTILKAGLFSIEANVAAAKFFHTKKALSPMLFSQFIALGPSGIYRYFRDSRILERTISRREIKRIFLRSDNVENAL